MVTNGSRSGPRLTTPLPHPQQRIPLTLALTSKGAPDSHRQGLRPIQPLPNRASLPPDNIASVLLGGRRVAAALAADVVRLDRTAGDADDLQTPTRAMPRLRVRSAIQPRPVPGMRERRPEQAPRDTPVNGVYSLQRCLVLADRSGNIGAATLSGITSEKILQNRG